MKRRRKKQNIQKSYVCKIFGLVGGARVEAEGRVLTLAAATGMDENTAEEPKRIYPRESEFREFGEQFDYEFLPFSYTVMRIKTQKR